jgi:hypothetical protein
MFTAEHFKTWASMLLGIAVAAGPLFSHASPTPSAAKSVTIAPLAQSQVSLQQPEL